VIGPRKRPSDVNERAFSVVADAVDDPAQPEPSAVTYGRKGGQIGGRNGGIKRARNLSPERRSEIARKAATARWEAAKEV
jgi:hypothetical protein